MGYLVDGEWRNDAPGADADGRFHRSESRFRGRIRSEPDAHHPPSASPSLPSGSLAPPSPHRTLIARSPRGLDAHVGVSVVDPHMGADGWAFSDFPGCVPDEVLESRHLRDVYLAADSGYSGRVTTPVLWDREARTIVSNESRDIVRMFDVELATVAGTQRTLLADAGTDAVDQILDELYEPINNGVYRAGFAATQEAYGEACTLLFEQLDRWDTELATRRYLCGDAITEADIAFYATMVRFDVVYYGHFKCKVRRMADYRSLSL